MRQGSTARPGIGRAPLFPSPESPTRPVTRHLADKWLREAERLAGMPSQRGSFWYAYRRLFATARKHNPAQDVARARGWRTVRVVQEIYTQAEAATTLRVMLEEVDVRGNQA